ncbi:MAG TPA: hypothetical protein VM075_09060 [Anaerolineae bacterium]|nr:hypothetical protein [Anaerolineae bacterium]
MISRGVNELTSIPQPHEPDRQDLGGGGPAHFVVGLAGQEAGRRLGKTSKVLHRSGTADGRAVVWGPTRQDERAGSVGNALYVLPDLWIGGNIFGSVGTGSESAGLQLSA